MRYVSEALAEYLVKLTSVSCDTRDGDTPDDAYDSNLAASPTSKIP